MVRSTIRFRLNKRKAPNSVVSRVRCAVPQRTVLLSRPLQKTSPASRSSHTASPDELPGNEDAPSPCREGSNINPNIFTSRQHRPWVPSGRLPLVPRLASGPAGWSRAFRHTPAPISNWEFERCQSDGRSNPLPTLDIMSRRRYHKGRSAVKPTVTGTLAGWPANEAGSYWEKGRSSPPPATTAQTAETCSSSATRKDEPQPHAATTLGLLTLKPAPCRLSS